MKKIELLFLIVAFLFTYGCKDDNPGGGNPTIEHISGTQSPYGNLGSLIYVSSATVPGVTNVSGSVVANTSGVSTVVITGTVTDPDLKTMITNIGGFTISGDVVTAPTLKIKATDQGFESIEGFDPGILVKFDSQVGDTYSTSWGNTRTVTHKSTTDDYPWGGMNIKVLKVEEPKNSDGVSKIIYYANHNWGMVGIEFVLQTGVTLKFPVTLTAAK